MSKLKIKAPYYNMESTQYILSDFIPAFNEFRRSEDNIRFGCNNMSKNLIRVETKSKTLFKDKTPICPKCESKKIYTDGKVTRKLVFLIKGTQIVLIEKYKCKNCGKKFKTDLSKSLLIRILI
ncbi:hypothetical protein [Methanobrevibacter olleyae]|nr:hypothetical protein [Methanobrevibacter olleyae]